MTNDSTLTIDMEAWLINGSKEKDEVPYGRFIKTLEKMKKGVFSLDEINNQEGEPSLSAKKLTHWSK